MLSTVVRVCGGIDGIHVASLKLHQPNCTTVKTLIAADMLNDRVLPFFGEHNISL